jgi:hypothetical protein
MGKPNVVRDKADVKKENLILDYLYEIKVLPDDGRLATMRVVSFVDRGTEVSAVVQEGDDKKTRKRHVIRNIDLLAYVNDQL